MIEEQMHHCKKILQLVSPFFFNEISYTCSSSCTQYVSKFGKPNNGHKTDKGQFSFQSQEGQSQKCSNYCTISLIHILAKLCTESSIVGFSSIRTENFQMYKLGFEEAEEPEIKYPAQKQT